MQLTSLGSRTILTIYCENENKKNIGKEPIRLSIVFVVFEFFEKVSLVSAIARRQLMLVLTGARHLVLLPPHLDLLLLERLRTSVVLHLLGGGGKNIMRKMITSLVLLDTSSNTYR